MAPSSASAVSNMAIGPVTLPLFKLSHCTVSGHGSRLLWTHLPNRSDMFAVFDENRSKDLGGIVVSKQVLKLIRGGELLVSFNFLAADALLMHSNRRKLLISIRSSIKLVWTSRELSHNPFRMICST